MERPFRFAGDMPLVKVGPVSQFAPSSVTEVLIDGEPYAVCHVEGKLYAISGTCLHQGGPLGHGRLHGYNVACPWHMWEWDCRTGANDFNPETKVATYEIRVEGDDLLIQLP
jgi:nitrite reductase/ring-hydroxylating ferredoxin subunit